MRWIFMVALTVGGCSEWQNRMAADTERRRLAQEQIQRADADRDRRLYEQRMREWSALQERAAKVYAACDAVMTGKVDDPTTRAACVNLYIADREAIDRAARATQAQADQNARQAYEAEAAAQQRRSAALRAFADGMRAERKTVCKPAPFATDGSLECTEK